MGDSTTSTPDEERLRHRRQNRVSQPWLVRRPTLLFLAVDGALLAAAAAAALVAPLTDAGPPVGWIAAYAIGVVAALATRGAYSRRLRIQALDDLRRVLEAVLLATMALISVRVLATADGSVAAETAALGAFALAFLAAGRIAASRALARGLRAGRVLRPTLILGAGKVGNLAAKRLLSQPELGLEPVGFLDDDPLAIPAEPALLPVLGAPPDLDRIVAEHQIEHFIVGFSMASRQLMLGLVRRCWELGVGVSIVPQLFEVEGDRRGGIDRLGGLALVALDAPLSSAIALAVKHAFDRLAAAIALVVLSPLLALVAIAIRLSMGSPVLYSQRRVGRNGQHFVMWKFRTLANTAETDGAANAGWAAAVLRESGFDSLLADQRGSGEEQAAPVASVEDRRTPLGSWLRRSSIDELPQLWNVLRGEMSLVGPRPELPQHVERFEEVIDRYSDRHRVKSGMTGWAQANGLRGDTSLVDRVEWDNYYIENWSLWLDVKTLIMTVAAIFRSEPSADDARTRSASNESTLAVRLRSSSDSGAIASTRSSR
ncbi:MAG: sugar transferase [Actinobacteria bacterium]|nr:sugar transferase [Actinomycetota bacterium]